MTHYGFYRWYRTKKGGRKVLCNCELFDFLNRGKGFRFFTGRNLPKFPDLMHNKDMEMLFQFALALLSAGAPWLAAVIVAAIAMAIVGPIKLSLSIGDRSNKRRR